MIIVTIIGFMFAPVLLPIPIFGPALQAKEEKLVIMKQE
jgi:hypothetical protein